MTQYVSQYHVEEEAVTCLIVSGRECVVCTAQSEFTKLSTVCWGGLLCEECLLHWKEFLPQINQQLVPPGFISDRASFGRPCPSDNLCFSPTSTFSCCALQPD